MNEIEKLLKKYQPKGIKLLKRKIASLRTRLKRGIAMDSIITLRCNYTCSYCPYVISGWKYENKEKGLKDWINFVNNNVAYPIKRMSIHGGEPSIIKWVGAYVNFLTSIQYKFNMGVTIYTNLYDISNFLVITPSPYLYFNCTYHEKYTDYEHFYNNFEEMLKRGYNMKVSKIRNNEKDISVITGNGLLRKDDYEQQCCYHRFRIAPDLTIHARAWDVAKYLKK